MTDFTGTMDAAPEQWEAVLSKIDNTSWDVVKTTDLTALARQLVREGDRRSVE